MTDHVCDFNLVLQLTELCSCYFNTVTPFSKYFRRLERARIKERFRNSAMRAFNTTFEAITFLPNLNIYVILTLIDKQSSSTGIPWSTKMAYS